MTRDPGWIGKVLLGGLLLLVLPPFGWVIALGFRSLTGERLTKGLQPPLPAWRGNLDDVFIRGAKASGVILTYLSPALVLYFVLGTGDIATFRGHWRDIASAILGAILFPPVVIPVMPVIAYFQWPWFTLTPAEAFVVLVLCLSAIALLPSAFLRVAATGRYAAALQPGVAARFAAAHARAYVEAWVLSLIVSAVAVLVVPLTPWLLFWSYLAILHAFLQVLWSSQRKPMEGHDPLG
jgi:hypothetical protein